MSVFAPTGELLFFVWAKKSNQKKAHPTAACFLRSKAFTGGWQKGLPVPFANLPHPCGNPNGLFPVKALVLGAADGGNRSDQTGLIRHGFRFSSFKDNKLSLRACY